MEIKKHKIELPLEFENRMQRILQDEYSQFKQALLGNSTNSIRFNKRKQAKNVNLELENEITWCNNAYYLNSRPSFTLDPIFHGGAYYVQEASSMFLSWILKNLNISNKSKVLDLCAAPGGKSTLIASEISEDSLLVANEVIRSRASILKENIIKWGHDNIIVTNNDPSAFSKLVAEFDLILIDAPCSGEGMFRKDIKAINEWSEKNIKLCADRQKRIISNVWNSLKPGAFMIYSTCTYNPNENEKILEWICKTYNAKSIKIEHDFQSISSPESECFAYNFYPHKTSGEGFFVGVIQKGGEFTELIKKDNKKNNTFLPVPKEFSHLLINPEKYVAYNNNNTIGIINKSYSNFIKKLSETLKIIYKGCELGEILGHKIKLNHALSLFHGLNKENCSILELNREDALKFLKKENIGEFDTNITNGTWLLFTHNDIALGWGKKVGNRINNYYPKEWRIRMSIN